MSFTDPALPQLPPQLETIIRGILSNSEQVSQGTSQSEIAQKAIEQRFHISAIIPSTFIIGMIIACILIYVGINMYTEYRVTKKHELITTEYSPIGKYILKYCWNFKVIEISKLRDDIEKIYEHCLDKYVFNQTLTQRYQEIKEHQKTEKILGLIKISIFILLTMFLLIIGLCGIYIGLAYDGFVLIIVSLFIANKVIPFIFPYKVESYEYLQYKSMRRIVERYEIEIIEKIKKRL